MVDGSTNSLRRRPQLETEHASTQNKTVSEKSLTKEEVEDEDKTSTSKTTIATAVFSPALITTLFLIFGGCCSNVYTLESILKLSPATGTLVTFLQFVLTSFFTLRTQITTKPPVGSAHTSSGWPRLRQRIIPLYKWLIYTSFFLAINILNNAAFNYRISVPLHIILRSAGPVTSMLVGYFAGGRRYTPRQIVAVLLLFAGVALAAWSDAQNKPRASSSSDKSSDSPVENLSTSLTRTKFSEQLPGFVLLFSALLLSALMGLYSDNLYNIYGRSSEVTNENIFYSHTLSLPYFAFQSRTLQDQYTSLILNSQTFSTAPLSSPVFNLKQYLPSPFLSVGPFLSSPSTFSTKTLQSLTPLALLLANALTQIVCITGVHRLSTQTTSLTVTIVLNIRKLVSLLLSIWLFGNKLAGGVVLGAVLVFIGGGLYGWKGKGGSKKDTKKRQ